MSAFEAEIRERLDVPLIHARGEISPVLPLCLLENLPDS